MLDYVDLLVMIPPKLSVSQFMGYLKRKSSLRIFEKHANLRYKYGNRHFWAEGYYVSTVWLNETSKNMKTLLMVVSNLSSLVRDGKGGKCKMAFNIKRKAKALIPWQVIETVSEQTTRFTRSYDSLLINYKFVIENNLYLTSKEFMIMRL